MLSDTLGGEGIQSVLKHSAALGKEGSPGFLMLSSIHLELERLGVHKTPRHFAQFVGGIVAVPHWIWVDAAGRGGEIETSHI